MPTNLQRYFAPCGLCFLMSTIGCSGRVGPAATDVSALSQENEQDDDHLEHKTPLHRPTTFLEAVPTMQSLHDRVLSAVTARRFDELRQVHPPYEVEMLRAAIDIALWLPEVAGDSDMPEGPWTNVSEQAKRIHLAYERLEAALTQPETIDLKLAEDWLASAQQALTELETQRRAVDPRWFEKTDSGTDAPSSDSKPSASPAPSLSPSPSTSPSQTSTSNGL